MPKKFVSIDERLISCKCCNYPISKKYYLNTDNNQSYVQLCSNCAELFRLLTRSEWLYRNFRSKVSTTDTDYIAKLESLINTHRSIRVVSLFSKNKNYKKRYSFLLRLIQNKKGIKNTSNNNAATSADVTTPIVRCLEVVNQEGN